MIKLVLRQKNAERIDMRNQAEEKVMDYFRKAVLKLAKNPFSDQPASPKDWQDHAILAMEIRAFMEDHPEKWQYFGYKETKQGFELEASIGPSITDWGELQFAIYEILAFISEHFLLVQSTIDETSLKYWVVTGGFVGSTAHGHMGVIKLKKEDIRHLNPHYFDLYDLDTLG